MRSATFLTFFVHSAFGISQIFMIPDLVKWGWLLVGRRPTTRGGLLHSLFTDHFSPLS